MAATAPLPTPFGRALPTNQPATMTSFSQPSTPMPFGARAIWNARNQPTAGFASMSPTDAGNAFGAPEQQPAQGISGVDPNAIRGAMGGPVTQTAPGGVVGPDMTDPNSWATVLRQQMPNVPVAGPPTQAPRLMVGTRAANNVNGPNGYGAV